MFRSTVLGAVASLLLLVSGCSMPAGPMFGQFYTQVRGPIGGMDNSVKQTKTGSATATGIVGVATGDASLDAAMKAGGITKVHHAESSTMSIMGVYSTFTTTVHGE
jgi:TRL-like protein family